MFCPNREKSNFSLPICLMPRITLQNASGDTLHNIRDKMIRKKCQKEWKTTSDLWHPNDGHLCGPWWQNNLLQRIRIVFHSFFTSPVYIWQKMCELQDSKTCFCRRILILKISSHTSQMFVCHWLSPNWVSLLFLFCCSSSTKLILSLSPLNIFVALAKILVSYALGIGGGAAISDNGSRITHPTHPIWWALTGPFRC